MLELIVGVAEVLQGVARILPAPRFPVSEQLGERMKKIE